MAKKTAKKKTDLNKILKKYEPVMKKTGSQLAKALKAAEEDVAKMYRIAQMHVDIQMKHLKKEKIYHDLGKSVAPRIMKGELDDAGLSKFKKQL